MTGIDVITFGETMVLVDPAESGPLRYVSAFSKSIGGTESNVAIALAKLRLHNRFLGNESGDGQGTRCRYRYQLPGPVG
jgi:sugar/nucleoside kinase (ribokinase family)